MRLHSYCWLQTEHHTDVCHRVMWRLLRTYNWYYILKLWTQLCYVRETSLKGFLCQVMDFEEVDGFWGLLSINRVMDPWLNGIYKEVAKGRNLDLLGGTRSQELYSGPFLSSFFSASYLPWDGEVPLSHMAATVILYPRTWSQEPSKTLSQNPLLELFSQALQSYNAKIISHDSLLN